jgi:hypothetical protein
MFGIVKGKVNGMAKYAPGIYKRGKISWICYKSRDSKIVRKSAKTDDLGQAESLLAMHRKAAAFGEEYGEKVCRSYTFMELADKYRAVQRLRNHTT